MGRDVLRRVRWGNVALAAAVAAALVLAVAWPRIAGSPPPLPRDAATPLVDEAPRHGRAPAPAARPVREGRKPARPPRRSPRRPRKHRAKPRPAAKPRSAAKPRPAVSPLPAARAPRPPRVTGTATPRRRPSSGAGEFGFER